jgi:hypothetical protein
MHINRCSRRGSSSSRKHLPAAFLSGFARPHGHKTILPISPHSQTKSSLSTHKHQKTQVRFLPCSAIFTTYSPTTRNVTPRWTPPTWSKWIRTRIQSTESSDRIPYSQPKITAQELLDMNLDIVIVTPQFVQAQRRHLLRTTRHPRERLQESMTSILPDGKRNSRRCDWSLLRNCPSTLMSTRKCYYHSSMSHSTRLITEGILKVTHTKRSRHSTAHSRTIT